mgnify:CR=1 FL=1
MNRPADMWWWTIATGSGCDRCGSSVKRKRICYEPHSRSALCPPCADLEGVAADAVESRRARRAREEEAAPQLA